MITPEVYCSHTEMRATESLVEHPRNYNTHPKEQVNLLAKIIRHQGWRNPITVSKRSGYIVKGHARLAAAKLLELEKVPVDVQEYADEASEYADMIADNRIAELAEADQDALKTLLTDNVFDGFDIELTGFTSDEVNLDFGSDEDVNDDSESAEALVDDGDALQQKWGTKLGQIWELGNHRLMCGDSTNQNHIESLMDGEKAVLCFTSPPYNVGSMNIKGNKRTQKKYVQHDDNMNPDDYFVFLKTNLNLLLKYADEVFYNVGLVDANKRLLFKLVFEFSAYFKDVIYWRKSSVAPHIQPGVINNLVEFILCFGDGKRKFKNAQFSQGSYWNVIEGNNASMNKYASIHKATFPVYLPENIIKNFSKKNSIVMESFCGTGTTLIACEQLNRKCYAMEISPKYVAVAIQRWHDLTGDEPVLLETT